MREPGMPRQYRPPGATILRESDQVGVFVAASVQDMCCSV